MYIKNNKSLIFISKDKDIINTPILFIHGFTGSSKSWNYIRKNIKHPTIAMDIPGHGRSVFNYLHDEYTYKDLTVDLYLSLKKINIKKVHLCGYSMGGRIAIAFAQKYPDFIESIILESTSLGISNNQEKLKQYDFDIDLSQKIVDSYDDFITEWEKNKLFTTQKNRNKEEYDKQSTIRKSHNKEQLSKSLLSFSKGNMPSYKESFALFDFPVFLINGSDDTNYIKHSRDMMKIHKKSQQFIISNSSHNTHLENPIDFISILNNIVALLT